MSAHVTDLHHDAAHDHPGEHTYIKIAAILTVVTIAEVAIYYIESLRSILVPALIIMSVGKFIAVVSFFMHLKFDDKRLFLIFASAMGITVAVVGGIDALHRFHAIEYAGDFLTGGTTAPAVEH